MPGLTPLQLMLSLQQSPQPGPPVKPLGLTLPQLPGSLPLPQLSAELIAQALGSNPTPQAAVGRGLGLG